MTRISGLPTGASPHQRSELFDSTEFPCAIEPLLAWAVETENAKPTLAGNRLHPVGFLAGWGFRPKVEINTPVSIFYHLRIALIVLAGVGHLFALEHRTGLRVVDHERPEPLRWGIGWNVEFVGFGPIQVGTAAVP